MILTAYLKHLHTNNTFYPFPGFILVLLYINHTSRTETPKPSIGTKPQIHPPLLGGCDISTRSLPFSPTTQQALLYWRPSE